VSAIKCPSCEYRNFHASGMCINCGTPLDSPGPGTRQPSSNNRSSPRNRPISSEERIPRNKPLPDEERIPKPTPSEQPSSRNRPIPPSEQPSSRNRPIPPSGQPSSRNRPIPPSEQPSSRNKPIPSEQPSSRNKPIPSEQPSSRNKPIPPSEQPSSRNKPIPSGQPSSRNRPIPPSEQPSSRNKPIPPSEQPSSRNKPIPPSEQRIPRNRSYSKVEATEQNLEARAEVYSAVDPYVSTDDLSRETKPEAYSEDHEVYSEDGGTYSEDHEVYSEDHGTYSENRSYSRELVPYSLYQPGNSGLIPSSSTALELYKVSTAIEEYLPQGILPMMPTFPKEEPPSLNKKKLPWGLPKRDPDVAGTIIQIQQSQELPEYPNLIIGITNMLTELIWLIPNDTMKKEEERLQVTTVRIRCNDAEKKDARLIGYLRGANLTLGDNVWFWGWHRKGSIIVRKGYNWTSEAVVTTHTLGLVMPALTLLILLGIGFLMFLAWPSMSSAFGSFLRLTKP